MCREGLQHLKHIIYRHIKDHGEKFINKLPQFVSSRNCRVYISIGKSTRDVKKTNFHSIGYHKSLTRYFKPKIKVKDRVEFQSLIFLFERDKNHNLKISFSFWQYLQKSLLHTSPNISKKIEISR